MKKISSLQNPFIKKIVLLQEKSRERKSEGSFVIDGWKEIKMAAANGYAIETLLFREGSGIAEEEIKTEGSVEVTPDVFDKISYRGNTSAAVAIARQKEQLLSGLTLSENPLLLVLDGIEKPGNLGAMLRTADAAGIDAVICCDLQTDIYNPNVIRSSVGCVFGMQVAVCSREEALQYLRSKKIAVFTASLKASKDYAECDYTKAAAFVLGTEATGVDASWEDHSDENIIIPMRGQNDSLNVSSTAAILLFEALRQRRH